MALKAWDNSFSVNHTTMDSDHQQLLQMIQSLNEAMKMGQSKTLLDKLVTGLNSYSIDHFSREEKHLTAINYADINAQQQQHAIFLNKVNEFKMSLQMGDMSLAIKMLPFLNDWFLNHIMKTDMKYK
jgi:hemerythrin